MRTIFKSFYKLQDEEYKTLWQNAIFIFDTNILLNLYRYQSSTRDGLLNVIERLANRIWIPHHVALEFQRNRLYVISEQDKRYAEVRNIVSKSLSSMENELNNLQLKKRHSHINPDKLIDSLQVNKKAFFEQLNTLEEQSISLSSDDQILEKLDALFLDKVGNPIGEQKDVDALFSKGEERFKKQIPPGFKDSKKDEKKPDDFTFGGISYKRKFGDYIIWQQIINHAKENNLKDIIFITDDGKSDWWLKVESNGTKTIGARPELIDEITREANVERFYIYNTESFLNFANEQLNVKVAKETIEEVREVSYFRSAFSKNNMSKHMSARSLGLSAEKAIFEWLHRTYDMLEENRRGFPDIISYQGEFKFGFEVKMIRDARISVSRLHEVLHRAYYAVNEEGYDEISVIFVALDEQSVHRMIDMMHRKLIEIDANIKVIVGRAEYDEESDTVYGFESYEEFRTNSDM